METGGEKVSTQTMAGPSTMRVAVIGAGVSGLAAAQKLFLDKQNAFDVNIYEGTNRVGGRINTCKFGKYFGCITVKDLGHIHTTVASDGCLLRLHFSLEWEIQEFPMNLSISLLKCGHTYPESLLGVRTIGLLQPR